MRRLLLFPAALFFLAASALGRPVAGLWNSPDETANAFWAERVAAGEPLAVVDAVVGMGEGAVHPRSMAVSAGALVPGSFPGLLLLYGATKAFFRLPVFLYAPFLTALAGLCLGALSAKLFGRKVGTVTALLFFVHPAILYYGSRGLFHNILFLDALIFAAAFFALRPLSRSFGTRPFIDDAFGGFVLGWALLTRANEALWVLPAFAAFLPFAGPGRWRRLAFALLGALVPLLLFLRINAMLYGSPLRTAYVAPAPIAASAALEAAVAEAPPEPPAAPLLPFGLHPRLALKNAWNYVAGIFWWPTLLAAAGFLWWLRSARSAPPVQKTYVIVTAAASAWITLLYGSWLVRDRFNPDLVTIGTSYVRYFLPIYAALLPFAGFGLVRLAERVRRPAALPAMAVLLAAAFGVHAAVFSGDESLLAVRRTLEGNAAKRAVLLERIEAHAVVMTERFDKLLVPERLRIIPSTGPEAFDAAAKTAAAVPTYWYGLTPDAVESARLSALASAHGLSMSVAGQFFPGETLYRFGPAAVPSSQEEDAHAR